MPKFNLSTNKRPSSRDEIYKRQYSDWKSTQKETDSKFFILYKDFDVHLKDISSGALKLFIYYGFSSKNETGESWFSIDSIRDYFQVSARTINSWNAELEKRGLIARESSIQRSKTTYLLPFSTNVISLKNKAQFESFISKDLVLADFLDIYGKLTRTYHLFQWRKAPGSNDYSQPCNEIIFVFSKIYGSYCHKTIFSYTLDAYEYLVDSPSIYDQVYTFDSNLSYENVELIQGLAINSQFNIKSKETLKSLVNELFKPEVTFADFKKTNLIKKEDAADE